MASMWRYCRRRSGVEDVMSVGSVECKIVAGRRDTGTLNEGRRRSDWKMARGACVCGVMMSLCYISKVGQPFLKMNLPCPHEVQRSKQHTSNSGSSNSHA